MKQSPTLGMIAPALVKALAAIKGATKDRQNPHFKNDYATLESVIEASRDALATNDLCAIQGPGAFVDGKLTLTTRLLHSSGEWIESTFHMPLAKTDPQGTGSALTYARRYALMAALNVSPVDDDAEAASGRPEAPQASPEAKRAEPKPPTLTERADRLLNTLKAVQTQADLRKAYDLGAKLCADLDAKDPERLAEINTLYETRFADLEMEKAA